MFPRTQRLGEVLVCANLFCGDTVTRTHECNQPSQRLRLRRGGLLFLEVAFQHHEQMSRRIVSRVGVTHELPFTPLGDVAVAINVKMIWHIRPRRLGFAIAERAGILRKLLQGNHLLSERTRWLLERGCVVDRQTRNRVGLHFADGCVRAPSRTRQNVWGDGLSGLYRFWRRTGCDQRSQDDAQEGCFHGQTFARLVIVVRAFVEMDAVCAARFIAVKFLTL